MLSASFMVGPRASYPAEPAVHPLRAALAESERLLAASAPALAHLLSIPDRSLVSEAVVAQVSGMLADLAQRLATVAAGDGDREDAVVETIRERLGQLEALRAHCLALALEWRLALQIEHEAGLDPVMSPLLQELVSLEGMDSLAMAALAAQARFAQAQRRMQLQPEELPAEIFHDLLGILAEVGGSHAPRAVAILRNLYDEATTRLALFARLALAPHDGRPRNLAVDDAGVALWLSALSMASGEDRGRTACAANDPTLGRLLLTLRAAGLTAADAERQALRLHPDAELPGGLEAIGTREAAHWLAKVRP